MIGMLKLEHWLCVKALLPTASCLSFRAPSHSLLRKGPSLHLQIAASNDLLHAGNAFFERPNPSYFEFLLVAPACVSLYVIDVGGVLFVRYGSMRGIVGRINLAAFGKAAPYQIIGDTIKQSLTDGLTRGRDRETKLRMFYWLFFSYVAADVGCLLGRPLGMLCYSKTSVSSSNYGCFVYRHCGHILTGERFGRYYLCRLNFDLSFRVPSRSPTMCLPCVWP